MEGKKENQETCVELNVFVECNNCKKHGWEDTYPEYPCKKEEEETRRCAIPTQYLSRFSVLKSLLARHQQGNFMRRLDAAPWLRPRFEEADGSLLEVVDILDPVPQRRRASRHG